MSTLSAAATACVDRLVDAQRTALNAPGAALAVTDDTGLLYQQSYGFADLAAGTPVSADTLFEIGSISKSFTALLALQDSTAGRLDLHAPVQSYLPWFSVQTAHSHPITVHHLLGHTSGIVQGTEVSTEAAAEIWSLRDTPAIAVPGTWFHYSNTGYKTIGAVLESLHDHSYADLLRTRVLDPLGLSQTEPTITSYLRPRLAVGYEALRDDRPLPPGGRLAPATWVETGTADGSIASTATDLAAYLRALMTPGAVVTKQIRAAMTAPGPPTDDLGVPGSTYGYGWSTFRLDDHRCLDHGGGMVGYSCHVIADLDARLGVVLLTNGPGSPGDLARSVLQTVRADCDGRAVPEPPAQLLDPSLVPNASELAGGYASDRRQLRLRTEGDRLITGDGCSVMRAGVDRFHVTGEGFSRFVVGVQREGGEIVALTYGPERLARADRADRADTRRADAPPRLDALTGHWRAHNPWLTNFRTFARDGQLLLASPGGVDGGDEQPLIELSERDYRIGRDPRLPERLSFSMVVDGRPQQVSFSGALYHRTFTA